MGQSATVVLVGTQKEDDALILEQIGDVAQEVITAIEPAKCLEIVDQKPSSIALLYLDHLPETILSLSRTLSVRQGCVPIIVSRDRDPEKILQAMRSGAKEFA